MASNEIMKSSTLTVKFLLKWVVAGVCLFLGVAGGTYTGMALSGRAIGSPSPESMRNTTLLEIGETFPNYEFQETTGSAALHVSDLAAKGPIILVFASSSCSACDMMNTYWRKRVLPNLDDAIRVVMVYDSFESAPDVASLNFPASVTVVVSDRQAQIKQDGINSTPTIIGIQKGGVIGLIVTGFDKNVDAEFIEEQLG